MTGVSPPPRGYLASGLTGLDADVRRQLFELSDVVAGLCTEAGIELYEPRAATDPVHHPEVPDAVVFDTDMQRVLGSDLVIFLADHAGVGAGQELVIAHQALIPIVVIAHREWQLSRMVTGMLGDRDRVLRYRQPGDLATSLPPVLAGLPELLRPRRLAAERLDDFGLLDRVRRHGGEVPDGRVAEGAWNPSVLELAALAAELGVGLDRLLAD